MSQATKEQIISTFKEGTKIGDKTIVSLSIIKSDEISGGYSEGNDWEILSGRSYYEELLCGLTFRVSPFAFF